MSTLPPCQERNPERPTRLGRLVLFATALAFGLGAFAKLLGYLLERRHDLTMAVLVGLLAGSLRALWPWVAYIEHTGSDGAVELVPDPSRLLAPGPDWLLALGLAVLGFAFVTALAWVGRRRLAHGEEAIADELGR